MFAVPIDQSGLAGFVPVRRQTGSSIGGLAGVGRNIFGQKIEGLPSLTDRRNLELDIGGTDIGRIPQIEQRAPFIPADVGFDEYEYPEPESKDKESESKDKEPESKDEDLSPFSFSKDEGLLGTIEVFGRDIDLGEQVATAAVKAGLTTLAVPAFASIPIADLAGKAIAGQNIQGRDIAWAAAKGLTALSFPALLPLVVLAQFLTAPEGEDFDTVEDLGHNLGEAPDAPPGGFVDDTSEDPGVGQTTGAPGLGEDPAAPPDAPTVDDTTGPVGDPSPSDGPDAAGDVGDDPGSACWVAGTQILMADNTYRNIEDLQIGDMVMSYPETKKTRRWHTPLEAKPIVSLLVDVHPEIWHLNNSMVSGTEWMIKGDGTAAIVQWLNVGDTVLGPDNNLVEITRVEPAEGQLKKQVIYNFETKDNYTYIADGMRTIRGRAVRGEQWGKDYLSGDKNSYEGSMQDEYNKKFNKLAA